MPGKGKASRKALQLAVMRRAAALRDRGASPAAALKQAWKDCRKKLSPMQSGDLSGLPERKARRNPLALSNMAGRPGAWGLPRVPAEDLEMAALSKVELQRLGTKRAKAELARRAESRAMRADIIVPERHAIPRKPQAKRGRGKEVMTARFPGKCAVCGGEWERGEEIVDSGERGPMGGKKMAHVQCPSGKRSRGNPLALSNMAIRYGGAEFDTVDEYMEYKAKKKKKARAKRATPPQLPASTNDLKKVMVRAAELRAQGMSSGRAMKQAWKELKAKKNPWHNYDPRDSSVFDTEFESVPESAEYGEEWPTEEGPEWERRTRSPRGGIHVSEEILEDIPEERPVQYKKIRDPVEYYESHLAVEDDDFGDYEE